MEHDTVICIFYIHTTEYPMHTWAQESQESKEHLHKIHSFFAPIVNAQPDAMVLITADHTVKHKSLCWDLEKACLSRNTPIKIAISPERDKYFKHHRGFGGTSYIYLRDTGDRSAVAQTLRDLKGGDERITKHGAVQRFHLIPERNGDLMQLGDTTTIF